MKKMLKNKKGFTLIELLAVIVVLAIIMVIATQQVNKTIKKSRANSFVSSYKTIVKEIKSRMAMNGLGEGDTIVCDDASNDSTQKCSYVYDISAEDYTMKVTANATDGYDLSLTGKGKFAGMELGTGAVECPVSGKCATTGENKGQSISVTIDSDGRVK